RTDPRSPRSRWIASSLRTESGVMTCVPTWMVDGCDGFSGPTDLIVRGVSVNFIRGVQVLSVRLLPFPQRWWRHAITHGVQGTPQGHAVAMLVLSDTMSV